MKRKVFIVCFFLIYSFSAKKVFSQQVNCGRAKTTIFFGNGVLTTEREANYAAYRLKYALKVRITTEEYEKFNIIVAHNRTGLDSPWYEGGPIKDLFEVIKQALEDESSRYFRFLSGVYNAADMLLFGGIPDFFADGFASIASRIDENAISDLDVIEHVELYKAKIVEGQKVIVVSHSQGNFFVNRAYEHLSTQQQLSFGIVSVGNPASQVKGYWPNTSIPWPYTTAHEDIVINVIPTSLASNISNGFNWNDKKGHGFVESYIRIGAPSRLRIINNIIAVNNALIEPVTLAQQGIITVTVEWGNQPDIDLHVFEPDGTHVYYRNLQGTSGHIDLDIIKDYNGDFPEHYYVDCNTLEVGTYHIGLNYYRGNAPETVNVTLQAGGAVVRTISVRLPYAVGSSGDNSPVQVADIIVSENTDGSFDFSIQGH